MKKKFRITIRHGIYLPIAMLICCVPAAQAGAFQSEGNKAESDKPAATEQKSSETEESASDQTKTDEAAKSVKEQLAMLAADYERKLAAWEAEAKNVRTRAAAVKMMQNNPKISYASELLDLYEENPDDKDAQNAVRIALEISSPRTVTKASKALLEIAGEQELEDARKSYITIAKSGSPASQRKAVDKLIEFSEDEKDDAIALEMLKPIVGPRSRYKVKEAVELIWDRVKKDLENADFNALAVVGLKASPEASAAAFNAMLEYHSDHKDFAAMLAAVPQRPNEAYEAVVNKVVKDGEGDLQVQAAISLAKYIKIRARFLDLDRMNEKQLARLDKENKDLKKLLRTFDDESELHKQAQSELFELEHLVPGAEALDIVGTDLKGDELKLSDYRGKVVFLDFWGDW